MEVHHLLMLFLAVFCGSLTEYQLEHKIEKNREKQYMRSMIRDLNSDPVNMSLTRADKDSMLIVGDSITLSFILNNYGQRIIL